jgi:hypothetical protein
MKAKAVVADGNKITLEVNDFVITWNSTGTNTALMQTENPYLARWFDTQCARSQWLCGLYGTAKFRFSSKLPLHYLWNLDLFQPIKFGTNPIPPLFKIFMENRYPALLEAVRRQWNQSTIEF